MEESALDRAEKVYVAWDEALANLERVSESDLPEAVEALLNLYTVDAEIESPLIPHLMGTSNGVLRGHEQMRPFFTEVGRRKPSVRKYFRKGFLADGKLLMWEYPASKTRRGADGFRRSHGAG